MSLAPPFTNSPVARRALAAVYQFHDVFYSPFDPATPPIRSTLTVSIPALRWIAYHASTDATYRFSTTLGDATPPGGPLDVQVTAPGGEYVNHEPFTLTLPLALSSPPLASDFLIVRPLWPTRSFAVPEGETAVIGRVTGAPGLAVAGLKVVMFTGAGPPPALPYTRTDANGEFLFRFPGLPGAVTGGTVSLTIAVSGPGPIAVSPATVPVVLGQTQVLQFTRT